MAENKFRFVSPGVFLNEIDNSQLERVPEPVGPVVVGRTERGPGLRPVKVTSMREYIDVFGNPVPGGDNNDPWRNGNKTSPMYAGYAAKAWLANGSPLTVVRTLGVSRADADTSAAGALPGWKVGTDATASDLTAGDAYGLLVFPSASATLGGLNTGCTGTLAAVWYMREGTIKLSGNDITGRAVGDGGGQAQLVTSTGADFQFTAHIANGISGSVTTASFNFNADSDKYIRKVFNTNPTLVNTSITTNGGDRKTYFLGETFERAVYDQVTSSIGDNDTPSASGKAFGAIVNLRAYNDRQIVGRAGEAHHGGAMGSKSGWVVSQDTSADNSNYNTSNMQKLFRLCALDTGEWLQNNRKIVIRDIKPSLDPNNDYGTFTVQVTSLTAGKETTAIETFTGCNLNPTSEDFVGAKIGTKYVIWDETDRRYREYGDHENRSKYVRVELDDAVGTDAALLPAGFLGPTRLKSCALTIGTANGGGAAGVDNLIGRPGTDIAPIGAGHGALVTGSSVALAVNPTFQVKFPAIALRLSSSDGGISDASDTLFGWDATERGANKKTFERSNIDLLRVKPANYTNFTETTGDYDTEFSVKFSLDDVAFGSSSAGVSAHAYYSEGNRVAGISISSNASRVPAGKTGGDFTSVLDAGFDSFAMPMFGGSDGFDITERDPLRNTLIDGKTELNSYGYNSIRTALDTVSDAELVEMNLLAAPGVTANTLTDRMIELCEDRGDALAIVDVEKGYEPEAEGTKAAYPKLGTVKAITDDLKTRKLNSSYGCSFYPWVQTKDELTTGNLLWVPPSVAALGTFSSNDRVAAPWFAPAGFTRGGLSGGAAGIPILGVRQQLSRKERDALYERNINPIAKFPAEGIVVFGQKTLSATPSALDRINVRRMLIHVKKGISRISSTLLFDQNVQATWNRFLAEADPFLANVKMNLGLSDYKIVLDTTTTTPDLVDRNIMYAKILLKPARAIEFIAVDFVIMNTGASFDD